MIGQKSTLRASLLVAVVCYAVILSPRILFTGGRIDVVLIAYTVFLYLFAIDRKVNWRNVLTELSVRCPELYVGSCWIAVIIINLILNRGDVAFSHLLLTVIAGIFYFMSVLYASQKNGTYPFLRKAILVIVGINAGIGLVGLITHPAVARLATAASSQGIDKYVFASMINVGTYSHYMGYAICFPVFLAIALHHRGIMKTVLLAMCCTIAASVLLAMFAIAFSLLIVGAIFFGLLNWFVGMKCRRRWRVRTVLLVIFGILMVGWSANMLKRIPQVEFVTQRMYDWHRGVQHEGILAGDPTNPRGYLTVMTLKTIAEYPLFGIGPSGVGSGRLGTKVGGHNSWLDQLAEYGVLGFAPYLLFLYINLRKIMRSLKFGNYSIVDQGRAVSFVIFAIAGLVDPVALNIQITVLFGSLVLGAANARPDVAPAWAEAAQSRSARGINAAGS